MSLRKKLTKLTTEQEARLPFIAADWIKIGLDTAPADRPRAEAAIGLMYQRAGLEPPRRIAWCSSPISMILTHAILSTMPKMGVGDQVWDQVGDQVGAQVWDQVRDQVRAQVRAQVWAQVRAQVGAQVRDQVWDQVRAQVGAQVGDQVRAQVWAQVRAQVGDQVWDQVGAQVWDQVRAQVWAQVRAQVGDQVRAQVRDQVWDQVGNSWYFTVQNHYLPHWLAFYAAFHEFGVADETQRLDGLWEFSKSAGWLIPCREIAFVSERHNILHRNARGQLHCEDGPALAYPDGWGIYAVNGVRVPAWLIETPDELTLDKIDNERNSEIQRVMIERFGWERFLEESKAEIIDHDEVRGTLYRTRRHRNDDPILMLLVTNRTAEPDGSFKKYILPVHHELRPLPDLEEDPRGELGEPQKLTAHNAVASTFGLRGEQYAPEMES